MTTLDLSFLEATLGETVAAPRPVNVYEILRDGWRETRVDMTLQFFLDPSERHGLDSLVIDALLRTLDGSPLIDGTGQTETGFTAADYSGSDTWEIHTQAEYIDVLAVNRDLRIAVLLENKIGHELHNQLDVYAQRALQYQDVDQVIVAVLAPERREPSARQASWLSRSVTYTEFIDQIKGAEGFLDHVLNPDGRDQRRSLDLLQQFIEVRNGPDMPDLTHEAEQVDEWRSLQREHEDAIRQFDRRKREIGALLRGRNIALGEVLAGKLPTDGPNRIVNELHGGGDGGTDFWNAYDFGDEATRVELKLTTMPDRPNIYVQWASAANRRERNVEPLGLDWTASDDEITDAFVRRVLVILEAVRGGSVPEAPTEQ